MAAGLCILVHDFQLHPLSSPYISPAVRQRRATEASEVAPSHSVPPDTYAHTESTHTFTRNTQTRQKTQKQHSKPEKTWDEGQIMIALIVR